MREIRDSDLNTMVLAKYEYRTYWNAFTFYALAYNDSHWTILKNVALQSNYTQFGGGMRITIGNLDWVTQAHKDETFKPCTIGELLDSQK
jgi:hypothetical protein